MSTDKLQARAQSASDQAWKSAEELRGQLTELESTLESHRGKYRALTPRENDLARFALTIVLGELSFRMALRGDDSVNS